MPLYNQARQQILSGSGSGTGTGANGTPPPGVKPPPASPQPGGVVPPPTNPALLAALPQKNPLPQYTFFAGDEEKLALSTRTNARVFVDQHVSDQLRVGYYLETCKLRRDLSKTAKCLWRKTDPYFDDRIELKTGTATVLLEGVDSLKFRYMGDPKKREWSSNWKTKEGDPSMRDKFPVAVEITMTVVDPATEKAKPITVQTVALIRNPNNETSSPTPGVAPGSTPVGGAAPGTIPGATGAPGAINPLTGQPASTGQFPQQGGFGP